MFTGIVSGLGTVVSCVPRGDGLRLGVSGLPRAWLLEAGESIALSGVCLTVTDFEPGQARFDIGPETLSLTGRDLWQAGAHVNLERALRMGDALGGHIVSGHVDGLAQVQSVTDSATTADREIWVQLPAALQRYVSHKGSIALEGISLTVNECHAGRLRVNLIPHTVAHTTARDWQVGSTLRVEVDRTLRSIVETIESYFAHNKAQ